MAAATNAPADSPTADSPAADGPDGVRAWLAGVPAEQRDLVARIDVLMEEELPGVRRAIKWRKASQPLGVPFYGLVGVGWIAAMWSFKGRVGVGFFAGTLLDPEPPVTTMAGPWNKGAVKGRRIDLHDGAEFDEALLRTWLAQARALPGWATASDGMAPARPAPAGVAAATKPAKAVLLAGGNPQIPKGDGEGPVRAYLDAMPGWKQDVGRRLDHLIGRAAPGASKAVRWNSPFYGVTGQGWFASFHCFTKYVKVTFFNGALLDPPPPGTMKDPNARFLDVYEHDTIDEAQFVAWVGQAAALPGWGAN